MTDLTGTRVAFLATDGFEDAELTSPWEAVTAAGATAVLVSPTPGQITGKNGHQQRVDSDVTQVNASDFDALVLPGGVINGDDLRQEGHAVAFAKDFFTQHKPVGAICHAAWILVEADVVRGRTMTSFPSLKTDLQNAGATWIDDDVIVDAGFVTSRVPDDLPAFNAKLIEEIGEGRHREQTA